MRLSDIIDTLQSAKSAYGDLEAFTFDGPIIEFHVEPSINGLDMIHAEGRAANEVVLELRAGS